MDALRRHIRMSIALGVLSIAGFILSFLALNDIAHGEADLSLEWGVLRASALVFLMFTALSLATLRRVLKTLASQP